MQKTAYIHFADDTALLRFNESLDRLRNSVQRVINEVHQLRPNVAKTEILFLPNSEPTPAFTLPGSLTDLTVVKQHKHICSVIDSDLSFSRHVDYICSKVSKAVGYLASHCSHLPHECIRLFYHCYILPIFLYCSIAWSSLLSKSLMSTLEVHNKRILKVLFRKPSHTFLLPSCMICLTPAPSLVKLIENCVLLFILFVLTKPRHTCVNIPGFFPRVLHAIPALCLMPEHQLITDPLRFSLPILSGWPCLYQKNHLIP